MISFGKKKKKIIVAGAKKYDDAKRWTLNLREKYSYITNESEDRVMSIFKVTNKFGANHDMQDTGWFSTLLPMATATADYTFIEEVKVLPNDVTDEIAKDYLGDIRLDKNDTDRRTLSITQMKNADKNLMSKGLSKQRSLISSQLHLLVKSSSNGGVEKGILDYRNRISARNLSGVRATRTAGMQMDWLNEIQTTFDAESGAVFMESSDVYGQRGQLISKGFDDENGRLIGHPVVHAKDFNPSNAVRMNLKGFTGQVVIAGNSNFIPVFNSKEKVLKKKIVKNKDTRMHGASIIAQTIANDAWIYGKRIHHIMLSDVSERYRSADAKVFDMKKHTINPMEVYSESDRVGIDMPIHYKKLVHIFEFLSESKFNPNTAVKFEGILQDYYLHRANGNGMYTDDPEDTYGRDKVLANKYNHDWYPKMSNLMASLRSKESAAFTAGEITGREMSLLMDTLKTAMTDDRFTNSKTDIPDYIDGHHNQIYFDISSFSDGMQMAHFINLLSYVSATVREHAGDVVVIHGADKITESAADLVAEYRRKLSERGVRVIWSFNENEVDVGGNKITALDSHGVYGKLGKDVDYYMMARLSSEAFTKFNEELGGVVSEKAEVELTESKSPALMYISRREDGTNSVVNMEVMV